MARIPPVPLDRLGDLADVLDRSKQTLGFVPNSGRTLAHRPNILRAFSRFAGIVNGPGKVPIPLKRLLAHMASRTAGCQYCAAHTGHITETAGVDPAKIEALFEYETHPTFTEAERAALRVAQLASLVPNAVEDEDFNALRDHFDDGEIIEIVAVISIFGWYNRFNDTMATTLEETPTAFGEAHLAASGWHAGKHRV